MLYLLMKNAGRLKLIAENDRDLSLGPDLRVPMDRLCLRVVKGRTEVTP